MDKYIEQAKSIRAIIDAGYLNPVKAVFCTHASKELSDFFAQSGLLTLTPAHGSGDLKYVLDFLVERVSHAQLRHEILQAYEHVALEAIDDLLVSAALCSVRSMIVDAVTGINTSISSDSDIANKLAKLTAVEDKFKFDKENISMLSNIGKDKAMWIKDVNKQSSDNSEDSDAAQVACMTVLGFVAGAGYLVPITGDLLAKLKDEAIGFLYEGRPDLIRDSGINSYKTYGDLLQNIRIKCFAPSYSRDDAGVATLARDIVRALLSPSCFADTALRLNKAGSYSKETANKICEAVKLVAPDDEAIHSVIKRITSAQSHRLFSEDGLHAVQLSYMYKFMSIAGVINCTSVLAPAAHKRMPWAVLDIDVNTSGSGCIMVESEDVLAECSSFADAIAAMMDVEFSEEVQSILNINALSEDPSSCGTIVNILISAIAGNERFVDKFASEDNQAVIDNLNSICPGIATTLSTSELLAVLSSRVQTVSLAPLPSLNENINVKEKTMENPQGQKLNRPEVFADIFKAITEAEVRNALAVFEDFSDNQLLKLQTFCKMHEDKAQLLACEKRQRNAVAISSITSDLFSLGITAGDNESTAAIAAAIGAATESFENFPALMNSLINGCKHRNYTVTDQAARLPQVADIDDQLHSMVLGMCRNTLIEVSKGNITPDSLYGVVQLLGGAIDKLDEKFKHENAGIMLDLESFLTALNDCEQKNSEQNAYQIRTVAMMASFTIRRLQEALSTKR